MLVASLIVTCIVYFLCTCMKLSRERHSCAKITKGIAEKTNLVWEPCEKCDDIDDIDPMRSHVDEARRRRIKERLTHGPSSSVEIIIC